MDELTYWKVKSEFLQLMVEENQLRVAIQDVHNRRDLLLKTYNLQVPVKFDDVNFTVEEIKSDGK